MRLYLVSESKSTIEFELFPSMSVFPSCAALVIGPFKSETFQPRLSCLQFGAIDICTILIPHSQPNTDFNINLLSAPGAMNDIEDKSN